MKKVYALMAFMLMMNLAYVPNSFAQDEGDSTQVEAMDSTAAEEMTEAEPEPAAEEEAVTEEVVAEPQGFHQIIKTKFIEGGAGFMGVVLLVLILDGLCHLQIRRNIRSFSCSWNYVT